MDLNALYTLAEHLGRDPETARAIQKAHRDTINRKGHFRRTKAGVLAWVEPHQVHAHIAEHGTEPDAPESTSESIRMGQQAMEEAIKGHTVVHAMHRKGLGWVDFAQGDAEEGIRHILQRRDAQHAADPSMPDGRATLAMLPEAIAKGTFVQGSGPGSAQAVIEHNGVRVVLAKTSDGRYLLSGYQRSKRK